MKVIVRLLALVSAAAISACSDDSPQRRQASAKCELDARRELPDEDPKQS
jgi:hypothetical protein